VAKNDRAATARRGRAVEDIHPPHPAPGVSRTSRSTPQRGQRHGLDQRSQGLPPAVPLCQHGGPPPLRHAFIPFSARPRGGDNSLEGPIADPGGCGSNFRLAATSGAETVGGARLRQGGGAFVPAAGQGLAQAGGAAAGRAVPLERKDPVLPYPSERLPPG
jgi:hypothetical protein